LYRRQSAGAVAASAKVAQQSVHRPADLYCFLYCLPTKYAPYAPLKDEATIYWLRIASDRLPYLLYLLAGLSLLGIITDHESEAWVAATFAVALVVAAIFAFLLLMVRGRTAEHVQSLYWNDHTYYLMRNSWWYDLVMTSERIMSFFNVIASA
jgi:hypothetical protein